MELTLYEIPAYDDGDFSERRFKERYNADLANGLGNLIARVAKLCEKSNFTFSQKKHEWIRNSEISKRLDEFRFDKALELIWLEITTIDQRIEEEKPWTLKGNELENILIWLIGQINDIAIELQPFLPDTAQKILEQYKGTTITSQLPLFPRIV